MKKTLHLLPFAFVILLLAACAEEYEKDGEITYDHHYGDAENAESTIIPLNNSSNRIYPLLIGQWKQFSTSTVTNTVIKTADGIVRDNIQGGNTYEAGSIWKFKDNSWGSVVIDKDKESSYVSPTASPFSDFKCDFRWGIANDSVMLVRFYYLDYYAEKYNKESEYMTVAISWPQRETSADGNLYSTDFLNLTYSYSEKGSYGDVSMYYPGYTLTDHGYDINGCWSETNVEVTWHLQRN